MKMRLLLALSLLAGLASAQSTAGGAAEIEQLQVKREGGDVTIQVVLPGPVLRRDGDQSGTPCACASRYGGRFQAEAFSPGSQRGPRGARRTQQRKSSRHPRGCGSG